MAIVKATYTKSSTGAKITRNLFGSDGLMGRWQSNRMIDEAEKGSVFFRFVISPDPNKEDTKRDLHLREITEKTMLSLEEQLHKQVQWVAAEHDDHAPHRHIHVVAVVPGRLQVQDFQALRQTATEAALAQRHQRDLAREQQDRERFAHRHELKELLHTTPCSDGVLFGTRRDFLFLKRFVSVRPTKQRREIGNCLIVAPTRGGKGLLATSQLLTWKHSVIVNDIKGELFAQTAGYRATLGNVYVIDPTGVGHRYDPLRYWKRKRKMSFRLVQPICCFRQTREKDAFLRSGQQGCCVNSLPLQSLKKYPRFRMSGTASV